MSAVDVLAVMDRAREAALRSDDGGAYGLANDLTAAIDVVAELQQAADTATKVLHNVIGAKMIHVAYQSVLDDLRAALARCGGTP